MAFVDVDLEIKRYEEGGKFGYTVGSGGKVDFSNVVEICDSYFILYENLLTKGKTQKNVRHVTKKDEIDEKAYENAKSSLLENAKRWHLNVEKNRINKIIDNTERGKANQLEKKSKTVENN